LSEDTRRVLTVTQLNEYIKAVIEGQPILRSLYIKGEVSNFTNHYKTGHFYFTLKDEGGLIRSVMFKGSADKLKFVPENGMRVIAHGRVSAYVRDGQYQFYADDMEPDGIGALYIAYEQLKAKLEKEGLFDVRYKKPLPKIPKRVGIITSPTGAAIRDIINVLGRRFPYAEGILYPALVQGDNAAKSMIDGLNHFEQNEKVDIIVIGRGGGSVEDLWCFNNEELARAIFACKTPVVSCVGHETDFTIADFVADLRAPTPSAAAELCVPDSNTVMFRLSELSQRSINLISNKIEFLSNRVVDYLQRPCLKDADFHITNLRGRLLSLSQRPCLAKPQLMCSERRIKLKNISENLLGSMNKHQIKLNAKLSENAAKIDALSPLKVLSRGYGLVTKENKPTTAKNLEINDEIMLSFADGSANAKVISVIKEI
jgi:exodeoxyribonuclease VII large subunit